jgi:hypothetical protein
LPQIADLGGRMMTQFAFRLVIVFLSAVLGLQALWLLTIEVIRPQLPYFPASKAESDAAAAHRLAAGIAANVGIIRGDLWADYAITSSAELLRGSEDTKAAGSPEDIEKARAVAIAAATTAPSNSRMWLLLAEIEQRRDGAAQRALDFLKMSYYTAPNSAALIPSRLRLATRLAEFKDQDLQVLIGREVRTILIRRFDLRPALSTAYRDASPEGKRFIAAKTGEFDQTFSETIRADIRLQENPQHPQTTDPPKLELVPAPSPQPTTPPTAMTSPSPESPAPNLPAPQPFLSPAAAPPPLPPTRPPPPLRNATPQATSERGPRPAGKRCEVVEGREICK